MRTLYLDSLKDGTITGLSLSAGAFFAEAALVCLTQNGHKPGVILKVSGTFDVTFELSWADSVDDQLLRNWQDLNETVEYGATALALLLIFELTEFTFFGRATQKGVADYLLTLKGYRSEFEEMNPSAYLEVTGIWGESRGNTLNMRLNKKKEKIKQKKNQAQVFIVTAEFSVPKAKFLKL